MTKKKNGFFSKIKDKFKKDDDHLDDELYEDEEYDEEFQDDEYEEEEYEDEEYEEDENEGQGDNQPKPQVSTREDTHLSNPDATIELEIPEIPKESIFTKMKNKIIPSKSDDDQEYYEDEDYEDEDYEDEQEHENEDEDQSQLDGQESDSLDIPLAKKRPILEVLVSRVKNIRSERSERAPSKSQAGLSLQEMPVDQWLAHLLGPQFKSAVHKYFLATLSIVICLQIGKFAALTLSQASKTKQSLSSTQVEPSYNPRSDVAAIRNNNIFNAKFDDSIAKKEPVKKVDDGPKVCIDSTKKTDLPFKLLNTIVLQDSVKSVASVSKRGKIFSYREGDKMDSLAQIGRITRQKVVFKNLKTNSCEYLENVDPKAKSFAKNKSVVHKGNSGKHLLPKSDGIGKDGNRYTIKKSLRDNLLSNIGDVLTQAKAVQIKNPDGTLSFKMTAIVPGSIYSQLDIQDGDIINGINGKKFTNLTDLMGMFGKLKENNSYDISLKRNGTQQTLNYNFID